MAADLQASVLGRVNAAPPSPAEAGSAPRWRALGLLVLFSLLNFQINASTFNALGVVLPDMVKDLKWNWTEAGFGFTVLGATVGLSSLAPAYVIRRFGVRISVLTGVAVMTAGFICLNRTTGIWTFFAGAALCGLGYQMISLITGVHVIAALFHRRGFPLGLYFTFGALGGVAGPWTVWAVKQFTAGGWRGFWEAQGFVIVALGLACAALCGGQAWLAQVGARTDEALKAEEPVPADGPVAGWTVARAIRTPQFLILLAAYFAQLLVGTSVAALSVAHLTQRGVASTAALGMLSVEALAQTLARTAAATLGERFDPKLMLLAALAAAAVGVGTLSFARDYPSMLLYAIASGIGFGLAGLAVTLLLLKYFGRAHNLEIFARICLVGAPAALGSTLGGRLRDATGAFGPAFQLYAVLTALVLIAAAFMRPPALRAAAPEGT